MAKNKARVVVDTNIWISFLISSNFSLLRTLIEKDEIVLLFSNELIEELRDVILRPKMRRYFDLPRTFALFSLFDLYGEMVAVRSKNKLSRDPKDNFLLDLAVDGRADFLITGDEDLLILRTIKKTRILRYTEFIEALSKHDK